MTVLYVVVCAAGPARDVQVLVNAAKDRGYTTAVLATPSAYEWLDIPKLTESTGFPVRKQHRLPDDPEVLPKPDCFIVAPATFNTINKLANGIADTMVLSYLNEHVGAGTPIVVVPYLNTSFANHPAFTASVDRLDHAGVKFLLDIHGPRHGDPKAFAWLEALDTMDKLLAQEG